MIVNNKLIEDGTYSKDITLWYRGSSRSNPLDIEDGVSYNTTEQYGPGIYFTNRYETAVNYGNVSLYKMSIKNIYTNKDRIDIKKIKEIIEYCNAEDLEMVLSDWDEDYIEKPNIALDKLLLSIKKYSKNMPDALAQIAHDVFRHDAKEFLMCCRAADVVIESPNAYNEEYYLVLYNPKLAKLVDSNI